MAFKVTGAQLKAIFALSKKLGMDMEDLHGMAYRISGTDSLRTLSGREAGRMIEELKTRCGQPVIRTGGGAGRATEAQQRKIFRLNWAGTTSRSACAGTSGACARRTTCGSSRRNRQASSSTG